MTNFEIGERRRFRESTTPRRRGTDNLPATDHNADEPTVTVSFTSLVLLAICLVIACAVVAALIVG